jgi:hypothetical protein
LPIDSEHLLPRNWSIACWAVLLIWLTFTAWANFPYVMTGTAANDPSSELYELLGEYGTVSTRSGWPLPYMECTNAKTKTQYWLNYFPLFGLLNLLIAIIVHASIIAVMQIWARKFSILTLFTAIAAISILLVLGRAIYGSSNYYLVSIFVVAVYLIPLWLGISLLVRRRFQLRNAG